MPDLPKGCSDSSLPLTNQANGLKFEVYLEKISGIERVPGSGCGWKKGDLHLPQWLIESKHKTSKVLDFNLNWLDKAAIQASDNMKPFSAVVIGWDFSHPVAREASEVTERALAVWEDVDSLPIETTLKDLLKPITAARLREVIAAAKDQYFLQGMHGSKVYNVSTFSLFLEEING